MSRRQVLEWALLVAVVWLLGGTVGLVAGVAFVIYDLVSRPAPRDLLILAVLLLGLVPLVVLARGLPDRADVSPRLVEGNLVAHYLAGAGLALLVVGVLRQVRTEVAGGGAGRRDGQAGDDGRDGPGARRIAPPDPSALPPPPPPEGRR